MYRIDIVLFLRKHQDFAFRGHNENEESIN